MVYNTIGSGLQSGLITEDRRLILAIALLRFHSGVATWSGGPTGLALYGRAIYIYMVSVVCFIYSRSIAELCHINKTLNL